MARRTNDPGDPAAKKAPARRAATTPRKIQPTAAEPAKERSAYVAAGPDAAGAASGLNHDEVARRAYELYLRRGSRNGHDVEDWLEAERQLRGRGTR